MDMGNLKMTFLIDLVYELRGVNEKRRNAKSWRKDRSLKFSCQLMHPIHPMATRGEFVKKCLALHLQNQYSDVRKSSIKIILGMSSKEVVHRILIKGGIQKLWPKMSFFRLMAFNECQIFCVRIIITKNQTPLFVLRVYFIMSKSTFGISFCLV